MSLGFSNIFRCLNRTQSIQSLISIDESLDDEITISVSSISERPITTQPADFESASLSRLNVLSELMTYTSSEVTTDDEVPSSNVSVLNESSYPFVESDPPVVSTQERFEQIRAQNMQSMQSAQANFALNAEREAVALAKLEQENNKKITETAGNIRLRRGQKIDVDSENRVWVASGIEAELVKKAEGTKKAELKLTSEFGLNFTGFLGAQARTGTGVSIYRQDNTNRVATFSEIAFEGELGFRVPGLAYDGLEPTSFVALNVPASGSTGLRTNYNMRHEWVTDETRISKMKVGFIGACLNAVNVLGSYGGAMVGANMGCMEVGAAAAGTFATGLATLSLNAIPSLKPTNRIGINMAAAEVVGTYRHRDLTDPTKLTDVALRFERRVAESGGIFVPCSNTGYQDGQVDNYSALIFTPLDEIQEDNRIVQSDDDGGLIESDNTDEDRERMTDLASELEPSFNPNAQIVVAMVHEHQE